MCRGVVVSGRMPAPARLPRRRPPAQPRAETRAEAQTHADARSKRTHRDREAERQSHGCTYVDKYVCIIYIYVYVWCVCARARVCVCAEGGLFNPLGYGLGGLPDPASCDWVGTSWPKPCRTSTSCRPVPDWSKRTVRHRRLRWAPVRAPGALCSMISYLLSPCDFNPIF